MFLQKLASLVVASFSRPTAALVNRSALFRLALLAGMTAFNSASLAQDINRRELMERDHQNLLRSQGGRADINEPRSFTTIESLLSQLHSIVEADVASISFDYLDCQGPRTVVDLENVRTLLGGEIEPKLTLRTFGGYLPNGHYVYASELPRYVLHARYILFLRNTDWTFSPVIGDLAFREETIAGKAVLIDSDGVAVSGVGEAGILRDTPQLTEVVGRHVKGTISTREIVPNSRGGEVTPCETGKPCSDANRDGVRKRSIDLVESGRFSRPNFLSTSAEQVSAGISAGEMIERMKRFADAYNARFDGKLQMEPRIGCWNVTPTQGPQ